MNKIELTKESKDLGNVYWVTSIKKAKDEVRDHIRYVYVKDNTITSTDGERLHHAKLEGDYPGGFYVVVKRTRSLIIMISVGDDFIYPDFTDIIKPASPATKIPACIEQVHGAFADVIRAMDKKHALNFHYFEDVVNCNDMFIVSVGDNGTAVILQGDNKTAVIMPMRI